MFQIDFGKFLGQMCLKKHDYMNTGKSLRYVKHKKYCVECVRIQKKKYKLENKEIIKIKDKLYRLRPEAMEKEKERKKLYNQIPEVKVRSLERRHEYIERHKETVYKRAGQLKRNTDERKITDNLRRRIRHSVSKGFKSVKTLELLGCSPIELKAYLESKFEQGMTWENYGKEWQIDHKKPCASFNLYLLEEQKECFHYTNLQPLFHKDHIIKTIEDTKTIRGVI